MENNIHLYAVRASNDGLSYGFVSDQQEFCQVDIPTTEDGTRLDETKMEIRNRIESPLLCDEANVSKEILREKALQEIMKAGLKNTKDRLNQGRGEVLIETLNDVWEVDTPYRTAISHMRSGFHANQFYVSLDFERQMWPRTIKGEDDQAKDFADRRLAEVLGGWTEDHYMSNQKLNQLPLDHPDRFSQVEVMDTAPGDRAINRLLCVYNGIGIFAFEDTSHYSDWFKNLLTIGDLYPKITITVTE